MAMMTVDNFNNNKQEKRDTTRVGDLAGPTGPQTSLGPGNLLRNGYILQKKNMHGFILSPPG